MLAFLLGTIVGAGLVLFIIYVIVVDPWGPVATAAPFIDQFRPIQVPDELLQFLKTGTDGQGISKWESCLSLSIFLHMFYQEHKNTRVLRRWVHKRLQMELNDIATRSAAGRLLQDIRIRDLSLGTKFPIVNAIRVEKVELSEEKNSFENVTFLVDVDYTGGFETSIDVSTMFGKKASLSLKITKLAGILRIILSRKPFNHWTMSFVSTPQFETDISSEIQGHQLKRLIPLIKESIKRALQRKHVWPNYKIRYRPVFPNPLLQPSPPLSSFAHIKLKGGLEVTVLQCSRLNANLVETGVNYDVYCTLSMDQRPFLQNTSRSVAHSLSVMLVFSRYDLSLPIGLSFEKYSSSYQGPRPVRVAEVIEGSLADKALFRPGDLLVAINNVPIRSERQATRFLQQTSGDLMVLVDRNLDELDEDELKETEEIIGDPNGDPDEAFISLDYERGRSATRKLSNTTTGSSHRRHSLSVGPSLPSRTSMMDTTDSVDSSLFSIDGQFDSPVNPLASSGPTLVQRTESARVPHVLVSHPSIDLRRTRSESQIAKTIDEISGEVTPAEIEDEIHKETVSSLNESFPRDDTLKNVMNMIPAGGSMASLVSTTSNRTEVTDDGDDECSKLSRERQTSTRRQRIHATLQAGKKRVLDFIPQKKKSSTDPVEMGAEAEMELLDRERETNSPSPIPSCGKRSPIEAKVEDKKEKRTFRKSRSAKLINPSPKQDSTQDSPTLSAGAVHSRTTKSVQFQENVMWGQSIHFDLDGVQLNSVKGVCKYLNVTVHAKQSTSSPVMSTPTTESTPDPKKPILLGYTSLYIPQLIDDCKLTLSNCHREVFFLKPPTGLNSVNNIADNTEFARHAGFDPRLCYGDITLGFRLFPDGLPTDVGINPGDTLTSDQETEPEAVIRSSSPLEAVATGNHVWKPWTKVSGAVCSMCRGKIWLKSASCCQRCLVICHIKCVDKANTGIACTPNIVVENDNTFEDVEQLLNSAILHGECPETTIPVSEPSSPYMGDTTTEYLSRRTKLKNKVSEKFSSWRRGKKKEDAEHETASLSSATHSDVLPQSGNSASTPVASIQDCLPDLLPLLEGSPFISNLHFQPGNAYNEDIIKNAKTLGKLIFAELPPEERVVKINEQLDLIQKAIRDTKNGRLAAMKGDEDSDKFENLDERLQALAVLMLHYCSALQECVSIGRQTPDSLGEETDVNVPSVIMAEVAENLTSTLPSISSVASDPPTLEDSTLLDHCSTASEF